MSQNNKEKLQNNRNDWITKYRHMQVSINQEEIDNELAVPIDMVAYTKLSGWSCN